MKHGYFQLFHTYISVVFVLGENWALNLNDTGNLNRVKRGLVFPLGGTFKLVIGIGTPIKLSKTRSIAVGWNFQWQYPLAVNTSVVETYPPIISRQTRDDSDVRLDEIYESFDNLFKGHRLGLEDCLLRYICEEGYSSFNHQYNGVYGQILHILLSPSEEDEENMNQVYLDAQKAGKYGADCKMLYPDCQENSLIEGIFPSTLDKYS